MKNTIENQNRWLNDLEEGTKIVAKDGFWIRPKWANNALLIQYAENVFVNVETGDLAHYSRLSDLENPPRIYSFLELKLRSLSRRLGDLAERFAICEDCGRNRYTGAPCQDIVRGEVRTWIH